MHVKIKVNKTEKEIRNYWSETLPHNSPFSFSAQNSRASNLVEFDFSTYIQILPELLS